MEDNSLETKTYRTIFIIKFQQFNEKKKKKIITIQHKLTLYNPAK